MATLRRRFWPSAFQIAVLEIPWPGTSLPELIELTIYLPGWKHRPACLHQSGREKARACCLASGLCTARTNSPVVSRGLDQIHQRWAEQ
jgi:hypothetical protein